MKPAIPAALALAGAALFTCIAARAEPIALGIPSCPAAIPPAAIAAAPGAYADWTREQIAARPDGAQLSDRDAYRAQVTTLYQQELTAYNGQALKLAGDLQILNGFRAEFDRAKASLGSLTAGAIARGVAPIDPSSGGGTLTDADPISPIQNSPVQLGNQDLWALENTVQIDRAALRRSCDSLSKEWQVLNRLSAPLAH